MPDNNFDIEIPFPDYTIERIVFEEQRVTLLCSMRRPRNQNNSSWFLSSRFYQYIKAFFVVSDPLLDSHISNFYYPESRVSAWSTALEIPLESWESSMEPGEDRAGGGGSIYGTTKTSLQELVQQKQLLKQNLYASVNDDAVTQEGIVGSTRSDHYFELEIPFLSREKEPLNPYGSPVGIDVFSFMHIDVSAMLEDFPQLQGIDALAETARIGGKFKYHKCLQPSAGPNANLEKIEFVPALFRRNGQPYRGYAHYHAPQNPGPDGYIGWMAGPSGDAGDMEAREKLNSRNVRNNRVIFNLRRNPLNYDGNFLNNNNSYQGYDMAQSFGLGVHSPVDTPQLSLGEELINHLKSQVGQIKLIGEIGTNIYREQLEKAALGSIRNAKFNVMDTSVQPEIFSTLKTTPQADRTHYYSLFTINCEDILTYNSRFGHIFKNIFENVSNEFSRPILTDMISRCAISDIKITRRRVTRLPICNNYSSTGKRQEYDIEEPRRFLISAPGDGALPEGANSPGFFISDSSNLRCSISQVDSPSLFKRTYEFEDYDLWENVDYGTYEYVIELNFVDGVRDYLFSLHERFLRALTEYSNFLKKASIPYLDYENSDYYQGFQFSENENELIRRNQRNSGNYIISQDRFTVAFSREVSDAGPERAPLAVRNALDLYLDCLTIFGVTPFGTSLLDPASFPISVENKNQLMADLAVQNTNLTTYEFFYELFSSMLRVVEKNIFLREHGRVDTLNFNRTANSITSTMDLPSSYISLTAPCNASVSTIPKTAIMIEPQIEGNISLGNAILSANAPVGGVFTIRASRTSSGLARNSEANIDILVNPDFVDSRVDFFSSSFLSSGTVTRESAESMVRSAIDGSQAGSVVIPGASILEDPLLLFNNSISAYGGITFQSMATRIMSRSYSSEEEENIFMSTEMQKTLFFEIVNSKSGEDFERRVDDMYKDHYYVKEGLGELYNTVKGFMAMTKVEQNIKMKSSFKEIVLSGVTKEEFQKQKRTIKRMNNNLIIDTNFKLNKYIPGQGLNSELALSNIGIYLPESELPENIYLVNNIIVSSVEITGRPVLSGGTTAQSGPRSVSPSPRTTTSTGASQTTTQMQSTNYGGGGSSY